jgi:hypothetical protein
MCFVLTGMPLLLHRFYCAFVAVDRGVFPNCHGSGLGKGKKSLLFFQNAHACTGIYPTFCSVGIRGFFRWGESTGAWIWPFTSVVLKLRMNGVMSTLLYWCPVDLNVRNNLLKCNCCSLCNFDYKIKVTVCTWVLFSMRLLQLELRQIKKISHCLRVVILHIAENEYHDKNLNISRVWGFQLIKTRFRYVALIVVNEKFGPAVTSRWHLYHVSWKSFGWFETRKEHCTQHGDFIRLFYFDKGIKGRWTKIIELRCVLPSFTACLASVHW